MTKPKQPKRPADVPPPPKAVEGPTITCPKCQSAVPQTDDLQVFIKHLSECGRLAKVTVVCTFTVALGSDHNAQISRRTPKDVEFAVRGNMRQLRKLLKARPGMIDVFVQPLD